MKKILITGANSYIGTSFEKYIKDNYPNDYTVDTVDMIDGSWRNKSFSGYDSVFHVAGIAHQKETKENASLYYKVNRDLAVETAEKAKRDGVNQFIFLSSMSVYGMDIGVITKATVPNPKSNYGKSKLQAEKSIGALEDERFKVCIVRPPMVYGEGCKGNFQTVIEIVKKFPVFPKVNNERSMIYIENLTSFISLCIENKMKGMFFHKNKEYVRNSDMARIIADTIHKKIWISRIVGVGVCALCPFIATANKAFGNLIYKDTEDFDYSYCVVENDESIKFSL